MGKGKPKANGHSLPSGLDFFASPSAIEANPTASSLPSKKRKRAAQDPAPLMARRLSPIASSSSSQAPPKQKITLTGTSPLPESYTSFETLISPKHAYLRRNLDHQGIHHLWGVQGAVSGGMLSDMKRDLMVIAPTGSGKTLAYLLPLFISLDRPCRSSHKLWKTGKLNTAGEQGIRSLIVVPTHELALQTQNEIAKLSRETGWRCILLDKATEKSVIMASPGEALPMGEKGEETESEERRLGVDFLVATPERLHHLVSHGQLNLAR